MDQAPHSDSPDIATPSDAGMCDELPPRPARNVFSNRLLAHKGHLIRGVLVGFSISVLVTLLAALGHFRVYENPVTAALQALSSKKADDIVLLFITEDEYRQGFQATSPLSRARLARIIDALVSLRAKVIALDIDLSDRISDEHLLQEAFARAAVAGVTIVVPARMNTFPEIHDDLSDRAARELRPYSLEHINPNAQGFEIYGLPILPPALQEHSMFGGSLFRVESDGVFRNAEAFYLTAEQPDAEMAACIPVPSFPLAIAAAYRGLSQEDIRKAITQREAHSIHIRGSNGEGHGEGVSFHYGKGGKITPNFIGNYDFFERDIEIDQLLAGVSPEQPMPRTIFTDKIVLVGGVYDKRDFYSTPIGQMSGMEVIANITQSILHETLIAHLSFWKAFALEIAIGFFVALVFVFATSVRNATVICLLLLMPLVVGASIWAFSAVYYWFDFLPTYAGVMFHGIVSKMEEKKAIKEKEGK